MTEISPLYNEKTKEYYLNLWVKDSSAGVGTITMYNLDTLSFASLGHAVTETEENYILPITTGCITSTTIYSIIRGEANRPRRASRNCN